MARRRRPLTDKPIDELYAWIATNASGGEDVCTAEMGNMHMPLIGADILRIASLRRHAVSVAQSTGYPVKLVKFTQREVLEEL